MTILNFVKSVGRALTGPIDVLGDWAVEPLKIWENKRDQINKDNDLRRQIELQNSKKKFESEMQMKIDLHKTDLEIKMQTEISRINAETEEWQKDQQFARMKNVIEAVSSYQKKLADLNLNAVRAIGEMDIELREKAQDLILRKTNQYKELQDRAQKDAEDEFERILTKFVNNDKVLGIMIDAAAAKLKSIIDNSSKFLDELNIDIQMMNKNIDRLTDKGQEFILEQLSQFKTLSSDTMKSISNKDNGYYTEEK